MCVPWAVGIANDLINRFKWDLHPQGTELQKVAISARGCSFFAKIDGSIYKHIHK